MFLRSKTRKKDGKVHRYWSVVESRRVHGGRVVQKHLLHLGELNDRQRAGWVRTIEVVEGSSGPPRQLALFPSDLQRLPTLECDVARVRLDQIQLRRPRQWGGCWLACTLWERLELDEFWSTRLGVSRKGTRWLNVLKTLVSYRLIDPGSEFRLHREWFDRSAMADLLGEDFRIAAKNTLYRCLDRLCEHRNELFGFLQERWRTLFDVRCEILLYDLTSTYFECDPPVDPGKRRYGYSRDRRPDCVQVVIALVVTPEGFPLAYEIYPGNTQDRSTLTEFLDRIEARYGKADRVWLMDRGIPTEETLAEMRERGASYLVGTPKGRLTRLERRLLDQPWQRARDDVRVKLLEEDEEFYVYVESTDRVTKERAMRRRRLKQLWTRLHEVQRMKQSRDELLLRLGEARKMAGRVWSLVDIQLPGTEEPVTVRTFRFELNRPKLRQRRHREGRYLLRSNLTREAPDRVWEKYLLLTQIEQAFKDLKSDLAVRPIHHQTDERIEAHIFVSFLAYCLFVTLKNLLRPHAAGLTPRSAIEKISQMQMVDVHLPTTDGRTIVLSRYTEPERELQLVLETLKLRLPTQPPPRVYDPGGARV